MASLCASGVDWIVNGDSEPFLNLALLATVLSTLCWAGALAVADGQHTRRSLPLSAAAWYARYGVWLALAAFFMLVQLGSPLGAGLLALIVILGSVSWIPGLFAPSPRSGDVVSIIDSIGKGFAVARITSSSDGSLVLELLNSERKRPKTVLPEVLTRHPTSRIHSISKEDFRQLDPRIIWRQT
ncbi:MAG: hypothetical protein ACSLFF_06430 [Solirubrobacterales bacterium]